MTTRTATVPPPPELPACQETERGQRGYLFHGLHVSLSGPLPILAALHGRLRQFPASDDGPADLHVEFHVVPDPAQHHARWPSGQARRVYEPEVGEVVYLDRSDELYMHCGEGIRAECDLRRGSVRVSLVEPAEERLWLASHPFFTLPLLEFLKRRGRYYVHAAAVAMEGRAVLLPGTSGAGKSTLALALACGGLDLLGDDTVFLAPEGDELRILAFPDEIDVTDRTASWFASVPAVVDRERPPGWPKRPVRPEAIPALAIAWECRPAVLVFPRIAGSERSFVSRMEPSEALLELVPNVLLTDTRSGQAHLNALGSLVRQSRCFRLETGRDFAALPGLIRDLLD